MYQEEGFVAFFKNVFQTATQKSKVYVSTDNNFSDTPCDTRLGRVGLLRKLCQGML